MNYPVLKRTIYRGGKRMNLIPIKGENLREGMHLRTTPDPKEWTYTVGKITGACEKGFHFGNECYDRLGTWWVPETELSPPTDQQ